MPGHKLWFFVFIAAVAASTLFSPAPGHAQQTSTVVVLPFEVNADPELHYLVESLPQLLSDKLGQGGFEVVPHDRMLEVLREENLTYLDLRTARDMAMLTGAAYAVYGSFSQLGESISLDVRLVEAFGLKPDKPIYVAKKGLINVLPAIEELAEQIKLELLKKDQITDVQVRGTVVLDADVVLLRISTVKGDIYDAKKVNQDLKRIYQLGYFDDVSVEVQDSPTGKVLIYTVKEKPRIISVSVEGNDELDSDEILDTISTKSGSVLNLQVLSEDLNRVRELYRKDGYYNAEVSYQLATTDQNQARLSIVVDEGKKLFIEDIEIEGANQIDADDLKSEMSLQERGFLSWIFDTGVLKEELLERDSSAIEAYYANRGFIDVKVGQPDVQFLEDGIKITYHVVEGPRYTVREVSLKGDLIEDPEILYSLISLDELAEEGAFLDRSVVRSDTQMLTNYYNNFGYAYAEANADLDVDKENHSVGVAYNLAKNQKIFIRQVQVEGNTKTRENVIRREMLLGDGDLFNGAKLGRSSERLIKLDFFKTVDFETVPTGDPSQIDLKVKVEEDTTGSLSAGAGYSNLDKVFFGGSIEERNLFGRGYKVGFSGKFGARSTNFNLSFLNPRFYDTNLMVGGDAYWDTYDYDDYERDAIGGHLRFGYPLGEYTQLYWGYRLENYTINEVEDDAAEIIRDFEGNHWASVLDASVERDTTNSNFLPTRGTLNTAQVEFGGGPIGGDTSFIKYVYSSHWFQELFWGTVFHIHGQAGYVMENFGDDPIPPFERFYLGGIDTVRGYSALGISPRDPATGDLIGGNKEFFANIEYIFPVWEEFQIAGVTFFDAGNAWNDDQSIFQSIPDNKGKEMPLGLYKSFGVGIRWNSPLGPLRVDYGWPLDNLANDSGSGKLEFSVGTTF